MTPAVEILICDETRTRDAVNALSAAVATGRSRMSKDTAMALWELVSGVTGPIELVGLFYRIGMYEGCEV